jgi:hypothetical protein
MPGAATAGLRRKSGRCVIVRNSISKAYEIVIQKTSVPRLGARCILLISTDNSRRTVSDFFASRKIPKPLGELAGLDTDGGIT